MLSSRINTAILVFIALTGVAIVAMLATGVRGGPLDPPGPVASTQSNVIYQPASCAGFPIVLSAPGSYRLGGNITGCAGKDGIQISAGQISLDLGGFIVTGVPSSFDGIKNVGGNGNLSVSNGTIVLWGGNGLNLQDSSTSRVHNVISTYNGAQGIILGGTSALDHSTASANGGSGIFALPPAANMTISDCNADSNGQFGIYMDLVVGSTVDTCSVIGNGSHGIWVGDRARIVNNHVISNSGVGIYAGHSCYVENNDSSGNTAGIQASVNPGNCTVVNNKASANGFAGFYIAGTGGNTLVDSNHASGNGEYGFYIEALGPGYPNIVTRNFASANSPNDYFFGANTDAAPITTAALATDYMNISQ
jgi:parallel beta-helix repeat protein